MLTWFILILCRTLFQLLFEDEALHEAIVVDEYQADCSELASSISHDQYSIRTQSSA